MGFRATFVIEDYNITWPAWFCEKYQEYVWFNSDNKGVFASKQEVKVVASLPFRDLVDDMQRAIQWEDEHDDFSIRIVYLHECGGITRARITRDVIQYTEPIEWHETDGITHYYCMGCGDPVSTLSIEVELQRRKNNEAL